MTAGECEQLIAEYIGWLRQQMRAEKVGKWCEITTPFLDRHNDKLQIYVCATEDGLLLTDDGQTITDLRLSGCVLDTPRRRELLDSIINGLGVQLSDDQIEVRASHANFAQRKHNLLQAMLAVNDLFVVAQPSVVSLFKEDVERFLRLHTVRFTPAVKFTGRSGYDHYFDFVIPESKGNPERILRALNRPTRDSATSLMFAWTDTKDVRGPDSVAYAVINDTDTAPSGDILAAFQKYDIVAMPWSKRDEYVSRLAA